jgi:hypothetical protein
MGLLGGVGARGFRPLPRPTFPAMELELSLEFGFSFFLSSAIAFVSEFCFTKNLLSDILCFLLSVVFLFLSVVVVRDGMLDMSFVKGITCMRSVGKVLVR